MKNEGECLRSAFAPVPSPVLTRGSEPKATNDKGGPAQILSSFSLVLHFLQYGHKLLFKAVIVTPTVVHQ